MKKNITYKKKSKVRDFKRERERDNSQQMSLIRKKRNDIIN